MQHRAKLFISKIDLEFISYDQPNQREAGGFLPVLHADCVERGHESWVSWCRGWLDSFLGSMHCKALRGAQRCRNTPAPCSPALSGVQVWSSAEFRDELNMFASTEHIKRRWRQWATKPSPTQIPWEKICLLCIHCTVPVQCNCQNHGRRSRGSMAARSQCETIIALWRKYVVISRNLLFRC